MQIIDSFPHDVRDLEHLMIPVGDGIQLAARIWLPATAAKVAVPAILESVPYRKRDGTRLRDEPMHRWFAGHGYAAVRLDLRGSGESEGILEDEYTEREQLDAVDVIAWIAAQPWCDGNVGMMGKSWGGFSALQVAARQPPALRAVIAVCATDDRYADDAHYMGGCLLNENLVWGAMLMTLCAQPPDPALVGARWREVWEARLGELRPFPAIWLAHPLRDDYWRQGSVCEDFAKIRCATWAVSGWADGYSNAVPRLLAGLSCPRRGLIGPWAHVYPHEGRPGPAVGFLQEARRFWDRWLKDVDNGFDREPMLHAYLQDSARPGAAREHRAGRWIAEATWPSPRIQPLTLHFTAQHGLDPAPEPDAAATVAHGSPQSVGLCAGSWCGFGLEGELPFDQRADDGKSCVFDSAPLDAPLEILGAPEVVLAVRAAQAYGMLAVRLNEVFADGEVARVSYALLDLGHRNGHQALEPMPTDREISVTLRLNDVAHAFAPGNRVRLAVSTSYWPMAWPAAAPLTVTLRPAGCSLRLPSRPPSAEDDTLPPLPPPESAARPTVTDLHEGVTRRTAERDLITGEMVYQTTLDIEPDGGVSLTRFDAIDLEVGHGIRETFRILDDDPLSAKAEVCQRTVAQRDDWRTTVDTAVKLTADADTFFFHAEVTAREGDEIVAHREWRESVPRRR